MAFSVRVVGDSTFAPVGEEPSRIREGSEQQEAFWDEVLGGSGNVVLEARAGSGKTTTAREAMYRMRERQDRPRITYACFNNTIAREFGEKCPPGVTVSTLNALGWGAVRGAFGSQLDDNKCYLLMDQVPGGTKLPRYVRGSVRKLASLAKAYALRPGQDDLRERLADLVLFHDHETYRDDDLVLDWTAKVLELSAAVTAVADFDDQIWLACLHDLPFPTIDALFVDELHDLSRFQHELVCKMNPDGRTFGIGDSNQAIYIWRGAVTDSIEKLTAALDARVMPLTVTWRCPRSHVRLANRYVSDLQAAPNASEGTILHGDDRLVADARSGDMVLCRLNAPLVKACLEAVAERRPATMRGRKIGDGLVGLLKKADRFDDARTLADLMRRVETYRARELLRLNAKEGCESKVEELTDRVSCIEAVAEGCSQANEVVPAIESLFREVSHDGRVCFSSVHRAKGLEARRVHYIDVPYSAARDEARPPQGWELAQRSNLAYVAATRSKDHLSLVTPDRPGRRAGV